MSESNTESKQAVIERLLNFEYILAFINSSVEGVVLPDHITNEPTLTLKLSYHFEGKMEVHPDRIDAVLRFKGQYFSCVLPMNSIWGVSTPKGSNYLWMECAPESVLSSMHRAQLEKIESEPKVSEADTSTAKEECSNKTTPFLRRVK